jgi:signal transduction histidine kinase
MGFISWARRRSLVGQLLVRCLAALLIATALLVALEFNSLNSYPEQLTKHLLNEELAAVRDGITCDASGRATAVALQPEATWLFGAISSDLKYRILDAQGKGLFSSDGELGPITEAGEPFDPARTEFAVSLAGVSLLLIAQPVGERCPGTYIQVAGSRRLAKLARVGAGTAFLRPTVFNVLFSIAIFSIVTLVTLRRALRPVMAASRAAADIAPRNLAARVATAGLPGEIVPLINAFNGALDRLEVGFKVQQRFLATAAHELKTPLALIRGQIDMAKLPERDQILEDVDFMGRQVQQLLHLAEVSEQNNYVFSSTDVAAVAADATGYIERLAERSDVRLDLQVTQGLRPIEADRGAFFMLLKNLLENAIQHSPRHGVVSVAVDGSQLTVSDEGDGIPAEHLPLLFRAFWRGAERRNDGAGLGLAICREIADVHGWALTASNASPGARFTLSFAGTAVRPDMRSTALGTDAG